MVKAPLPYCVEHRNVTPRFYTWTGSVFSFQPQQQQQQLFDFVGFNVARCVKDAKVTHRTPHLSHEIEMRSNLSLYFKLFPCSHCVPGPPAAAVPRNCVRLDPASTNTIPILQPKSRLISGRYYLDPDTNERLSTWRNPLNNASVTVVHVSNDPVNNPVFGPLPLVNAGGSTQVSQLNTPGRVSMSRALQVLPLDVPLSYPNPLHGKASA